MEQKIYKRSETQQAESCRDVDEQQIDGRHNSADPTDLYSDTFSIQEANVQKLAPTKSKHSMITRSAVKTYHPSTMAGSSKKVDIKKRPLAKATEVSPKKRKKPMFLEDFNLDDDDEIIYL